MNPSDLIGRLANPDRRGSSFDPVQLFRAIRSEPVRASKMASEHPVSRQTLYRFLEPFVETGLIDQTGEGFQLTGAGLVFLQAYETARRVIDAEVIEFLTASSSRPEILHRLSARPSRKAELVTAEGSPSRSTIHRILNGCESYGLVVRSEEGAYTLTETGVEVLDAFDTLCVVVEQSVEKATFLNQIGNLSVDLPSDALDTAELVTVTESDPHAVVGRTAEVIEERGDTISLFRGLTPVFSPYMFKMFRNLADRNTVIEAIFDATAFGEARQPQNFPHFIGPLVHPNVSLRLYSERVPFGIGLFDDLLMFVGYLHPDKDEVAIITDDERLVTWAEGLFKRYWEESRSPSGRLKQRVAEYLRDRSVS